ncbi:glycosyltransferase [Acinetobacter schindleri]|uniref:glycosyltransferase n=1 Tax=Acinetobacter schindleri TaxID=108981 RepID=UPI0013B08550|nr:glycosyltransferase [Acinetobacter schindleri]QIC61257.1 glycosyltransferase [Acinetobacter schindleri]
MKILYLITGLGGGGAEKVVADLADQMSKRGHQVKIAYLKGEVVVRPKNSEIELVYLGLESIKQSTSAYKNYKKLLKAFQPDVVHAHMVHANIFARIARIFYPIPKLICTAHSNNEGGKGRMLAYRLTHRLSDITTNVSLSASKKFEALGAVPKHGITTVYNGINLECFHKFEKTDREVRASLGLSDNDFMLLAVGRLHEAKDYPNLFNATEILLKQDIKHKNIHLFVVGDGDLKPELEKLLIDKKMNNQVHFLGRRNDIPQLMSAANLFVLSSSFEGFGLVIAEAMACHTFVVGTDCGGVKEVMGNTGILVPPQNSLRLAAALKQAINMSEDNIIQNNMKAFAHVKKNFDLKIIVEKWLELYAS